MKSEVEFKLVEGTSPNRGPPSHSHKFIMIRHQFQAVRINSPCPHICYHWHCSFAQQAFQHFGRLFRACLCKVLLKLVSLHQMRLEDDKALKAGIGHYLSDLFGNPELIDSTKSFGCSRASQVQDIAPNDPQMARVRFKRVRQRANIARPVLCRFLRPCSCWSTSQCFSARPAIVSLRVWLGSGW